MLVNPNWVTCPLFSMTRGVCVAESNQNTPQLGIPAGCVVSDSWITFAVVQFAFPFAAMPVANDPLHCVGTAARARAVPACPLIFELVRATWCLVPPMFTTANPAVLSSPIPPPAGTTASPSGQHTLPLLLTPFVQ